MNSVLRPPVRTIDQFWDFAIPDDWGLSLLKYHSRIYAGGTPDRQNEEYWRDGDIPWLNSGAVNQWIVKEPSEFITQEGLSNSSARWVPSGALLLALAGQGKTKGMVALLEIRATCNQSMAAIVTTGRLNPRFLLWWIDANYDRIRNMAGGEHRDGLNLEMVGNIPCPVPPPGIQDAIETFLFGETQEIDNLIAAKERLLDLTAEKRRAVVAEAVLRGLDPSAPLRPSGIDWLGDIPSHWEVRRVATLFSQRDERNQPDLPLLEVSINAGVIVREFSSDKIEGTAADFNTYKVARSGDIAFNKMRMWQGAVGVAPVDGLVSPDYTVAEANAELLPEYAGQLFRTEAFSAECGRNSQGITWDRLRLYWDGFRDIFMPVPPLDEQQQIVEHTNAESAKISRLRIATENSIALLKERRAALIAAAVTGQTVIPEAA